MRLLWMIVLLMCLSLKGFAQIQQLSIPSHTATYCCNGVRGYCFRAPTGFTITGLRVPADYTQGTLAQSVAVVRFNTGTPPLFPLITNDFVQLARVTSQPGNAIIPVCIPVQANEWIGIYGDREGYVTYGSPAYSTTIFGQSVTLKQSGMNFSLQQHDMQEVWYQDDKIGRIEMFYTGAMPTIPDPIIGDSVVCAFDAKTYATNSINGLSYQWTGLPNTATLVNGQGTNSIQVNWGDTPQGNYTLSVSACRTECQVCSPPQTLDVQVKRIPVTDGQIVGAGISCADEIMDYEFTDQAPPGVTFTWSIQPPNAGTFVNGNTGMQIGIRWNRVGIAQILMTPSNSCGNGTATTRSVNVLARPPIQPTAIAGDTIICPNPTLESYSVVQEPEVSYIWSGLPPEARLVSGQNTNQITVDWGNTPTGTYNLTVSPRSICGTGISRSQRIWVKGQPQTPPTVFGNPTVCISPGVYTYNVSLVQGNRYEWRTACSPVTITPMTPAGERVRIDFSRITSPVPFPCEISVKAVNECGQSQERTITVNVIGTPNQPGIIQGGNNVCEGQTASYFVPPTPQATSYNWRVTPGGGHSFETPNGQPNVTFRWTRAGTYTVSVQALNICGQSVARTLIVTVNPIPATPILAQPVQAVCPGAMNVLYSVNSQPNIRYHWTVPNPHASIVSGQNTANLTLNWSPATPPGTYNISVQAFNGTCNSALLTFPVEVGTNVSPAPSNLRGAMQICNDTTVIYEADPVPGATGYVWENLPPNSVIESGDNTPRIQLRLQNVPSGNYSIAVRAVTACGNSEAAVINVNIRRQPVAPVFTNVPTVVCVGQRISLEVVNDPNVSYQWSSDCQGTLSPVGNRALLTITSIQTCQVSVRAFNSCGSSSTTILTLRTENSPRLTVPISGATTVCAGRTETYRAQLLSNCTYQWAGIPNGATIVSGQGTANLELNWGTAPAGFYNLTVTPSNGCGRGITQLLRVEVRTAPAQPTAISGATTVCRNATETYSIVGTPNVTYQWTVSPSLPGFPINGTSVIANWTQLGTYILTVNPINACGTGQPRTLTVSVTNQLQADAGQDQTICTNFLTITGTPAGGTWSCVTCLGGTRIVAQNNGEAILDNIANGVQILRYTITSGSCGTTFDEVEIENARPQTPILTADQTFCGTANGTIQLTYPNPNGVIPQVIRWESSTDLPWSPIPVTQTQLSFTGLTQTTMYRAIVNFPNRVCADVVSNTVTITVSSEVLPIPAQSSISTCDENTTLRISNGVAGTWAFVSGPGLATVVTSGTDGIVSGLNNEGIYLFRYTSSTPPCPERVTLVTVRKLTPVDPQALIWSYDSTVCANNTRINLTGVPNGATVNWQLISGPMPLNLSGDQNGADVSGMNVAGTYIIVCPVVQPACNQPPVTKRISITRINPPTGQIFAPVQVCADSYTLQANVPMSGSGRWQFVSGVTTPTWTSNAETLNISNMPQNGTYNFAWIISNPPCADVVSPFALTKIDNSGQASVPQNFIEACTSAVTITANPPNIGLTGSWSVISGNATINTIGTNGFVTGMNQQGNYVFRWTVTGGTCGTSYADVTVRRNANIPMPNAGQAQLVCNATNAVLRGNSPPNGITGRWRFVSGPVTPTTLPSGVMLIVSGMSQYGTYTFAWEFTSGNCAPLTSWVTVTRVAPPTIANIQPINEVCGNTFTLRGNQPTNGTGRWEIVSFPGGSPRILPSGNDATVSNISVSGTYVVRYSIENQPCQPSFSEVAVVVNTGGNAGTLSANMTAVCSGNNTGTLTLAGYDGNIIRWESSPNAGFSVPSIINFTGQNYTFNNLTQTTYFRVVIKKQNCPEITSNVIRINVLPPLPQADAGNDVTICTNNVTLTGSNPGIFTAQWEFLAGGTTPTLNPVGNTVVITGMNVAGKYTFRYRISGSNPNCGASTDEVVVTVSAPTNPGTLNRDATYCSMTNAGTLNLTSYSGGIIRWETAENANFSPFSTIANQSDRYNYRNLTRNTWFRAVVKSGACTEATSNAVKISIVNGTVANAGTDQSICANQTTLTGNLPQTGTPTWAFVSGPVTPTLTINNNEAQVSGMTQEGTYVFEYRISNTGCAPSTDQVSVQVFGNGSAGTASTENTTICSGQTARLRLTGQQGTILRWESSTDQWQSIQTISNTTNDFTTAQIFINTQYRAVVKNGTCPEQISNSVLVTVEDANFTANAGQDQTLCTNQVTLTGNVPPSGTPHWRCISGPNPNLPTVSVNGTVGTANNLAPGNYVFEYSVDNRACGVTRDEVRIQVLAPPSGWLSIQDTLFCGSATGTIRINNLSGNVVRWELSNDNFLTANYVASTNVLFTFANLTQSTAFRALLGRSGCDSVYTNAIRIIVNPQPTTANAGNDQTLCGTSVQLTGNVPQAGIPSWTLLSAPNGVVPIIAFNGNRMTASGLLEGTYRFIYTISGEPCQPSRDTVSVQVFAPSVGGQLTASSNTLCAGNNNLNLTLSQYFGNILRWEVSPNNQDPWQSVMETTPTPAFSNLTQTTYFRAVVQTANCPESRSNVIGVAVLPNPVGGTLTGGGTFCRQNVSGALVLSGYVGSIVRWEASTDDFVSNIQTINNPSAQLSFSNLTQKTSYRVVVQSGSCGTVMSSVAVVDLVNNTDPGILTGEQTVCSGENTGTLTLNGQTGTILRWESSTDNFATSTSITNNSPQLLFNNLTQTTAYRAVIFNPGCANATSNTVTITVLPNTVGGTVNSNTTVCAGQNSGQLTLTGHSGNVVRWQSSLDGTNWSNIAVTTTTFAYQNLTIQTLFRAVVKNGNCPEKNATEALITVTLPSQGGTLSGGQTVCAPSGTITLTLTGQRGNILNWERSNSCANFSQPTAIANTLTTLAVSNLTQTTCYRVRVKNGVCDGAYSNVVTVQVQALPMGGAVIGDTAVCSTNPSGTLQLTGNNAPVIRWEKKVGNGNWITISNTTTQLSFNNLTEMTRYRVRVGNAGCSDTVSTVATVRLVAPSESGILSQNQSLCFGNNTAVLNLRSFQADSLSWESSLDSLQWRPIFHSLPDLVLNNLDTTTFYRVRCQNGNCELTYSNAVKITVTIRLKLSVGAVTGCNGRTNIQAFATGGREPYQYSISPIVRPSNNTGKFNDLSGGRYVISVSDANGCADTFAVVVGERASPPQVMDVINVTQNSALVRWVEVPPGTGVLYNLRYRVLNEPTWTLLTNLNGTYQLLTNLQNNTTYEVEVQYLCPNGGEWSAFSTQLVRRFTTLVMGTGDCITSGNSNVPIPGGIYLSQITPTTVVVNWNLVDNAMGYIISYGIANENPNNWTQIIVCHPSTSLQLNNLSPNANYRVRLRTNCSNCITALNQSDKRSAWSQFFNFTTPARRNEGYFTDESIIVYPNPTKDVLYVSGIETDTPYECFDAYGKRVGQGILTPEQTTISLSDKTAGVYLLKINGGCVKVVKE